MSILQPHFASYPNLMIPFSPTFTLSALPPPPLNLIFSILLWPHCCSLITSSPISRNGTDFRILLAESVKINNIIPTLSQFSINDFEVCLFRHIHHITSHQISLPSTTLDINSHQQRLLHSHNHTTQKNAKTWRPIRERRPPPKHASHTCMACEYVCPTG